MVKRLLDKVVVITGATSGIGLEIAKYSISQGAEVVISGRREDEGKKIKLTDGLFALFTILKYKFFKQLFKYNYPELLGKFLRVTHPFATQV